MRFEKLLLAFFAIIGGLLVAGVTFYIYQSTKTISPNQIKNIRITPPTPTSTPVLLTVDSPQNESVTASKTITVSGHTDPSATIVISTDTSDQTIVPAATGAFTTTVTIGNDENILHILAINSRGEEAEKTVTITYSTESF